VSLRPAFDPSGTRSIPMASTVVRMGVKNKNSTSRMMMPLRTG